MSKQATSEENIRCIAFMVIAMAGFAVEDAVIKQLSYTMPISQVLILIGIGGLLMFGMTALKTGVRLVTDEVVKPWFIIRTISELASAICFVIAIVYASLSISSVILQATPLAVSLAAALFLKQDVSVRQWLLISIGFVGVLCVIQPGLDGFKPAALSAVLGVVFLALRDAITRSISVSIPAVSVSFWAFFALLSAGVVTIPFFGKFGVITSHDIGLLAISAVAGSGAYFCIVMATRGGDVAVVAPFRYTRLLFALGLAVTFFDEQLNPMMLVGSCLIIGSGMMMFVSGGTVRQ
ncbi:MAG TPA: EamA family transporter [Gammaproteobacteria bacterium]|nr:EamA family transporter [Gammaproteobacteria bacterium]